MTYTTKDDPEGQTQLSGHPQSEASAADLEGCFGQPCQDEVRDYFSLLSTCACRLALCINRECSCKHRLLCKMKLTWAQYRRTYTKQIDIALSHLKLLSPWLDPLLCLIYTSYPLNMSLEQHAIICPDRITWKALVPAANAKHSTRHLTGELHASACLDCACCLEGYNAHSVMSTQCKYTMQKLSVYKS